ncbi:MAG: hypothetical protein RBT61_10395 [Candidatus Kapabacteria bacterium]|nr:hypothetical protein [Candidatus Kapabacteria bacterium]
METISKSDELNFEKVWFLLNETRQVLDSKFKETDSKFKETDSKFKETRQILDSKFRETDRLIKEMVAERKQQDKKTRDLERLFVNHWGELVESLVEGKLLHLLNNRGIKVNQTFCRSRAYYDNKEYEFDIIAGNGSDIVIVEVKTTLSVKYVKSFTEKLKIIKNIFPLYKPLNVLGAMAFLKNSEAAEKFAQNQGLITIKATGDSAFITNEPDFKPKVW